MQQHTRTAIPSTIPTHRSTDSLTHTHTSAPFTHKHTYLLELLIRQGSVSVSIEVVQEISQHFFLCLLSLLNSRVLSGVVDQLDVIKVDDAVSSLIELAESALDQLLTSIVHLTLYDFFEHPLRKQLTDTYSQSDEEFVEVNFVVAVLVILAENQVDFLKQPSTSYRYINK